LFKSGHKNLILLEGCRGAFKFWRPKPPVFRAASGIAEAMPRYEPVLMRTSDVANPVIHFPAPDFASIIRNGPVFAAKADQC
jgi:hypothetical protein